MNDDPNHHHSSPAPVPPGPLTLTLDIGGTGLKAGVLDATGAMIGRRSRVPTPHPSPPSVILPALIGLAYVAGAFDRVSVGFPGVVRDGRVITAPNLGTAAWKGYDLAGALKQALGRPVRMLNDATVQGLGVIARQGLECVVTLGTGVGFALYQNGRVAPHLELSHHNFRGHKTYEEYLGILALQKVGRKRWCRRVARMLVQLRVLVNWDMLYIGGGNARLIDFPLPPDVKLVSNDAGITGGVHLWDPQLDVEFELAT